MGSVHTELETLCVARAAKAADEATEAALGSVRGELESFYQAKVAKAADMATHAGQELDMLFRSTLAKLDNEVHTLSTELEAVRAEVRLQRAGGDAGNIAGDDVGAGSADAACSGCKRISEAAEAERRRNAARDEMLLEFTGQVSLLRKGLEEVQLEQRHCAATVGKSAAQVLEFEVRHSAQAEQLAQAQRQAQAQRERILALVQEISNLREGLVAMNTSHEAISRFLDAAASKAASS
eukprot:NODE_2985_length_848_cov_21.504414.p1 GENE.NODE_2985_length_848_cov_21.504414~~NODE_2985_length_848_cov_21.504414.p1  ORF type:complete len:256 (-),score=93.26 NODE_2985_length_848_cov_21.504414:81-794(-)